jgi:thiaminase/transcriptional activator TenA
MVAEIGAGTLPHETFRFYFDQNLGYLHEYARAIALTIPGAGDRAAMSILTRFLSQIVDVEIPANESFLTRLGGAPGRPVPLRPTAYAYTRHLLDVGRQGRLPAALAALLPCQWSYGEIGQRLVRSPPADPIYADWIALFAGAGYDDLVTASTDLLDRCCTPADQPATSDAFDRSTGYEVGFWQMAYTRGEAGR